jgi:hypothetical protein
MNMKEIQVVVSPRHESEVLGDRKKELPKEKKKIKLNWVWGINK